MFGKAFIRKIFDALKIRAKRGASATELAVCGRDSNQVLIERIDNHAVIVEAQ